MSKLVQTVPKASFLRSLQNQRWTTAGAIAELVDNSFGEGRGNAAQVSITWDATKRHLHVLDDGQGMDCVSRLFRLGDTIGRTAGDIGEYGSGGTQALIYLAARARVWTIRDKRCAHADVNWAHQIQTGEFPVIDDDWYEIRSKSAPTILAERGRGTLIVLEFPKKRVMNVQNVQKELSRLYAPAIRMGKRLSWRSIGRGSKGEEVDLHDAFAQTAQKEKSISIEVSIDGAKLRAMGRVGIREDLSISQSGISICFGPRLLKLTKDCFSNGDDSYTGVGMTGYVDLQDGWQPYLTTTKTGVDDDRAWDGLMKSIFECIRDDLLELETRRSRLLFDGISFNLTSIFQEAIASAMTDDGEDTQDDDGKDFLYGRSGRKGTGDHPPRTPSQKQSSAAAQIEFVHEDDRALNGQMCQIDVHGGQVSGFVNRDHQWVKDFLKSPATNAPLTGVIVVTLAKALCDDDKLLKQAFGRRVVSSLAEEDDKTRIGKVARLLADKIISAPAAPTSMQ